jgi:hypothetical protein
MLFVKNCCVKKFLRANFCPRAFFCCATPLSDVSLFRNCNSPRYDYSVADRLLAIIDPVGVKTIR